MRSSGPETLGPTVLRVMLHCSCFGRLQEVAADATSPHCCYADRRHYSWQKTLFNNARTPQSSHNPQSPLILQS